MGFHIQMQYSADSFEAPNAPTCRIDHVVAVFYAVFFRAANQKITATFTRMGVDIQATLRGF